MINNKLLEICKGEPNNIEQQYWTCFFFFFKAYKSKADTRTASGQKRLIKKIYIITLTEKKIKCM